MKEKRKKTLTKDKSFPCQGSSHLVHLLAHLTEPSHEKRADRSSLSRCFRPGSCGWWTTSVDIAVEEAGPDRTGVTKPEGFIDGVVEPRLWVSKLGHFGVMYRRPLQAVVRNLLNVTASRAARAKVKTSCLTLALQANGIGAKLRHFQRSKTHIMLEL